MDSPVESNHHIISFGKKFENLQTAISNGLIGSNSSSFSRLIEKDAHLFLHCKSQIWGIARVTSKYIYSEQLIWNDRLYPHRFKIEPVFLTNDPLNLISANVNLELRKRFGSAWAYKFIFSPMPLPSDIADLIREKLTRSKNSTFLNCPTVPG